MIPALEASERFEVNLEVNIQREQAGSGAGALTSRGGVHFPCAMSCSVSFDPYGLPVREKRKVNPCKLIFC